MIPQQMRFDDISDEYAEFVEKFKPKKTTDDCYTPEAVYDAVCYWVEAEYSVNLGDFVRPFWPGGDYERFDYEPEQIVVDNPPFSIISKICAFYEKHGIRYFLFAPYLTNFSIRTTTCHIMTDSEITYENGAVVNTSFVTNLEQTRVRTAPELADRIRQANKTREKHEKPVYQYPDAVLTVSTIGFLCRNGIRFRVQPEETMFISKLDAQKPLGKSIFGGGFLLSEAAEKEVAKLVKREETRVAKNVTVFQLSEREREIQKMIGGGGGKKWMNMWYRFILQQALNASCQQPKARTRRQRLRNTSGRADIRISTSARWAM